MKKSSGFTLFEIVVVIGVIAIALPATFAIIFAVIRQQVKVYALKQVKREGDFILNQMEDQIRNNSIGIFEDWELKTEVCNQTNLSYGPNDGNNFYFQDKLGRWFRYYADNTDISSQSAGFSANLNTPAVKINNFSLSCYRSSDYSPPIVSISFDVDYAAHSFQEQIAKIHYQTQVGMKNY